METIKERAYKAVGHPLPPKGSMITSEHLTWDEQLFRNGYIKGANEQRQIDIDTACEWLRNALKYEMDDIFICYDNISDFITAFEEAMKRE